MNRNGSSKLKLALLAALASSTVAHAATPTSATGAGFFANSSRVFAFNGVNHPNGTTSGEGVLLFAGGGTRFHFLVNCVSINGNVATLGGVITNTTYRDAEFPDVDYAGANVWFRVVDGGEGRKAAPDQISFFYFDDVARPQDPEGLVPSCTQDLDGAGLNPISSGNIQVK